MKFFHKLKKDNKQKEPKKQLASLYILFGIIVIFTVLNPAFLTVYNIQTILVNAVILFAVGGGQTFPILTGGIDLSVGGVISILSVLTILLLPSFGYFTFLLIVFIGSLIGMINGLLLTKGKIPSFIATLGIGGIAMSIASTIAPEPLSVSSVLDSYTIIINGKVGTCKVIYFWGALLLIFFLLLQNKTIYGKTILFTGSNERMAFFSGLKTTRIKTIAFILSGVGSAVTAIFLISTLYSGYATLGDVYILNSIACVIIGGTALSGGRGGIIKTVIGVLILSILTNGMTIIGINIYIQQTFLGLVVILAVIFSMNKRDYHLMVK